jgi:hypothetical protein
MSPLHTHTHTPAAPLPPDPRANEAGEDPLALSARFIEEFHHDMRLLGCLPPTVGGGRRGVAEAGIAVGLEPGLAAGAWGPPRPAVERARQPLLAPTVRPPPPRAPPARPPPPHRPAPAPVPPPFPFPQLEPKATDFIPQMVTTISSIIDNGHAYAVEGGDVFFDVASLPGYGRLSGRSQVRARP